MLVNDEHKGDGIDTETDLFQVLNDGQNDDDEGFLGDPDTSFEEDEEDSNNENDDDKNLWDDENQNEDENEEEDYEDEEEDDDATVEAFNKKLGTNFKDIDELKKSLKAEDKSSEEEREQAEYKVLTNKVSLYDKYIRMDNEKLIREQLYSEASGKKKDIEDPDVQEEIEEKLQGLKDLEQLDSMADTLRANLQSQKEKTELAIQKIDQKTEQKEAAIKQRNTEDLQNALADVYNNKTFMGVTVTKEDITEVYNDIRTDKFFQSVNGNQEMIAKLALFIKYEKEISKVVNVPTHSDRTKGAFETLANSSKNQRRSVAQANGSASSGTPEDNVLAFVK